MGKKRSFNLNIGIPNGIILTCIGILVLVTPLFHPLAYKAALVDIGAGLILIIGGTISFLVGLKTLKKQKNGE